MNSDWIFQARKLRNVKRCGTLRVISTETIAEHSYYVALIAIELANIIERKQDITFDRSVLLQKALFHDIEEGIMGDVPYPVKHASKSVHSALEESKEGILSEFFPDWIGRLNVSGKTGLEGELVHAADYIELYHYCVEEKLLGNRDNYWTEIMETCKLLCKGRMFSTYYFEYFEKLDKHLELGGLSYENKRIKEIISRRG